MPSFTPVSILIHVSEALLENRKYIQQLAHPAWLLWGQEAWISNWRACAGHCYRGYSVLGSEPH